MININTPNSNMKLNRLIFSLILLLGFLNLSSQTNGYGCIVNSSSWVTIRGLVKDEQGKRISFTKIILLKDKDSIESRLSDVNGLFSFATINPGTYRVLIKSNFYKQFEGEEFEITANNTTIINCTLKPKINTKDSGESNKFICMNTRCFLKSYKPFIKTFVTDEKGKMIDELTIWRFNSQNDSIKLSRNLLNDSFTGHYNLRANDFTHDYPSKWILIKARGYADVIIRNIKLSDPNQRNPVINIKMYPRQYLKNGDQYSLINSYVYENVIIKDSMMLDFKYYSESILNLPKSYVNSNNNFLVKTYPNPVKDYLKIIINAAVTKPYSTKLLDINGKLICETEITEQNSMLDMQWQSAGIYCIQVFDPEGTLLYTYKFVKT